MVVSQCGCNWENDVFKGCKNNNRLINYGLLSDTINVCIGGNPPNYLLTFSLSVNTHYSHYNYIRIYNIPYMYVHISLYIRK